MAGLEAALFLQLPAFRSGLLGGQAGRLHYMCSRSHLRHDLLNDYAREPLVDCQEMEAYSFRRFERSEESIASLSHKADASLRGSTTGHEFEVD